MLRRLLIIITAITTSAVCLKGETVLCMSDSLATNTVVVADTAAAVQPDDEAFDAWQQHMADSIAFAKLPWYRQLLANGFRIHDPHVNYPKFPRFILKVYDWGDRTFNSYDPSYVVGVGKNWKVTTKSFNWMESYMIMFSPKTRDMLHIRSYPYIDFGAYISFMALSVGYTAKMNDLFSGGKENRSNLNFNFTCSRLYANLDITSTNGNTLITHFGDYKDKEVLPYKFNDIRHSTVSGEAFYIFNYRKYSQAAAYCFSKYQLNSAGSWLLGFSFNNQNIDIDFSNLPDDMKEYLPDLENRYHYRYTDYDVCGGYAYNWALKPRQWLANITLFPAVGYRHTYHNSTDNRRHMIATSLHARFSFVYNHRALFASLTGRFDGHLYFNRNYTFFNAIESISLIVGARF